MTTFSPDVLKSATFYAGFVFPKNGFITLDDAYTCVDDSEAMKFASECAAQSQFILQLWTQERKDCDKFSRLTQAVAMMAHALQSDSKTGLAVGVLNYVKDDGERHSVNAIFGKIKGKSEVTIHVFEPQSGEELFLSDKEKENCLMMLI